MRPNPILALFVLCLALPAAERKIPMSLYEITLPTLEGKSQSLADYRGKVVLAVNVASECGYTPQYAGLQKLYTDYKDRGLVILGSPATSSAPRSPVAPPRSSPSARRTTA